MNNDEYFAILVFLLTFIVSISLLGFLDRPITEDEMPTETVACFDEVNKIYVYNPIGMTQEQCKESLSKSMGVKEK